MEKKNLGEARLSRPTKKQCMIRAGLQVKCLKEYKKLDNRHNLKFYSNAQWQC